MSGQRFPGRCLAGQGPLAACPNGCPEKRSRRNGETDHDEGLGLPAGRIGRVRRRPACARRLGRGVARPDHELRGAPRLPRPRDARDGVQRRRLVRRALDPTRHVLARRRAFDEVAREARVRRDRSVGVRLVALPAGDRRGQGSRLECAADAERPGAALGDQRRARPGDAPEPQRVPDVRHGTSPTTRTSCARSTRRATSRFRRSSTATSTSRRSAASAPSAPRRRCCSARPRRAARARRSRR